MLKRFFTWFPVSSNRLSFEDRNLKLHAGLGSKKAVDFLKDLCMIVIIVSCMQRL